MTTSYDIAETLVSVHRRLLALTERRTGSRADAEALLRSAFKHAEPVPPIEWMTRALGDESREAVAECIEALLTTLKPEYAEAIREGSGDRSALFRAREAFARRLMQSIETNAARGCIT